MNKHWRSGQQFFILAIASCLIILIFNLVTVAQADLDANSDLPPLRIHPLPESLHNLPDAVNQDNYFNQIASTPLGYLVWSDFPVTVFIQQAEQYTNSAADQRHQAWAMAVKQAITEWNVYLPLQEISDSNQADITVWRSQPSRQAKLNPDTGLFNIPRATTAETTYRFYLQQNPTIIAHKMKIEISPNYTGISLLATIRHELGHALGIWGHSENEDDALYFSQVGNPPPISPRDINTLKKIYQQSTRLGWKI